jgi:hypothetical protein
MREHVIPAEEVMKSLVTAALVSLVLLPAVSHAGSKKDPVTITCEEFASATPEAQSRVAAYLDGYSKGGKKIEDIDEIDTDRDLDTLVVSCTQQPKLSFWQKIEMKLPGGKKHVKIPMTCEDFLALGSDDQPEAAYYLAGYNRATKTTVDAAGEIDLEQDVAVLVQECKPAPKESLWARIKKHF